MKLTNLILSLLLIACGDSGNNGSSETTIDPNIPTEGSESICGNDFTEPGEECDSFFEGNDCIECRVPRTIFITSEKTLPSV